MLEWQNLEFKISEWQNSEFDILEDQNPEFKILEWQNSEFDIMENKILNSRFWNNKILNSIFWKTKILNSTFWNNKILNSILWKTTILNSRIYRGCVRGNYKCTETLRNTGNWWGPHGHGGLKPWSRKTVNRLERKQVYLTRGASTTTGGINLYIEQEKHKLDQIAARNFRASVIRIDLLFLQTSLIATGPGAQYRMQVSNMFTVNFMLCPSKANSWRF